MNPFSREYYDKKYQESEEYAKHYSKSVYYFMWRKVMSHLSINDDIVDLGCGAGHFGAMLNDYGFTNYTGIDFSSEAIGQAKDKVPSFKWVCDDLFNVKFAKGSTFVATETFEHIEDLKLIFKMPQAKIVFSVPNFDAPNHLRTYTSEEQIKAYYKDFIHIEQVDEIVINPKASIFVVKGQIK